MVRRLLPLALVAALVGAGVAVSRAAASSPRPGTVKVVFFRHGRLVRMERVVPAGVRPEVAAMRELVQGPTRLERSQGIRSALRPGVHLQAIRPDEDVWLARFSRSLVTGGTATTMTRRLAQIEATLAPL